MDNLKDGINDRLLKESAVGSFDETDQHFNNCYGDRDLRELFKEWNKFYEIKVERLFGFWIKLDLDILLFEEWKNNFRKGKITNFILLLVPKESNDNHFMAIETGNKETQWRTICNFCNILMGARDVPTILKSSVLDPNNITDIILRKYIYLEKKRVFHAALNRKYVSWGDPDGDFNFYQIDWEGNPIHGPASLSVLDL